MAIEVKVISNVPEHLELFDLAAERALTAIGAKAETHAKEKVPIDTGRLKNSITYALSGGEAHKKRYASTPQLGRKRLMGEYSGTIGDPNEKAVYVGTNVSYAQVVEAGSSKRKPKPYLRPAVTDYSDEYKKLTQKAFASVQPKG